MSKQDLATKQNTELATIDFEADANAGFENIDQESMAIPFLRLAQTNSPEVNEESDTYIEGLRPGMFFNSVTKEVFGKTVDVIPVHYKRAYNRWMPRSSSEGGFKGTVQVNDALVDQAKFVDNKLTLEDGSYLSDTRNHYVISLDAQGNTSIMLLALSSTQIKKSKAWMTQMSSLVAKRADGTTYKPPSFANVYTLESVTEKNAKGDWRGIKTTVKGPVTDVNLYNMAKTLNAQVKQQQVTTSTPSNDEF